MGQNVEESKERREFLAIVFLCPLWYAVTSSSNVTAKALLSDFPYPITVTIVQLTTISLFSGPLFNLWGVRRSSRTLITWNYYFRLIVPLAFGKFLGNVLSHVSIWKVPVSYAHTVKATMPLFTVVLSRLILQERQTRKVYLSLLPIVGGVAIATLTELSFNFTGLFSALASTMAFSLQNIYSKKVLHDTGVHHLRLLIILSRLALFLFLPVWLVYDVRNLLYDPATGGAVHISSRTLNLLIFDGFLNWMQNIVAFSVMSIVTPLTYAVTSASKRIFVIVVTLFILGNPVTGTNIFGMVLAIAGVLCYNKAKYDQRQAEKKKSTLPKYVSPKQNGHSNFVVNGWVNDKHRLLAV
ncbi:PREDICTED: solute carrier family 35 member E1 homolog [Ceratosolen solmsi marchali]|uniref:Solute carrier family 35 member E1 homolog n=1 Tax=Ceratosolen solmsi marchali TaxID=326594 RepID=A0AAJ6YKD4_9HYME|nr:PREDICTED: solute carrier family 35 member E1 homolog [Ceratosolen solmsi marchali]